MVPGMSMKGTAILPVKRLDAAKQRLSSSLKPAQRRELMAAMFRDSLEAIGVARLVGRVIVVTSDPEIAAVAEASGAEVLPDSPQGGHSQAAMIGIAAVTEGPAILLPGDCPLLEPREIDGLLTALPTPFVTVVPDRHGTGTNALVLNPANAIEPSFGEGSCARHVAAAKAAGIPHAVDPVPSLGLDMDTPADIVALATAFESRSARKRGRHTAKVLGL